MDREGVSPFTQQSACQREDWVQMIDRYEFMDASNGCVDCPRTPDIRRRTVSGRTSLPTVSLRSAIRRSNALRFHVDAIAFDFIAYMELLMRKTLLLLAPVVLLGGCTWGINPDPGSTNVRTVWSGDVTGCRDIGKITVSVTDHVGPYDRNDIKVRDELQVQARNSALSMKADTIKPLGDPVDGSQPWEAYYCGNPVAGQPMPPPIQGAPPPQPQTPPPPPQQGGGFQTYPTQH
jgi:hypothetical protein